MLSLRSAVVSIVMVASIAHAAAQPPSPERASAEPAVRHSVRVGFGPSGVLEMDSQVAQAERLAASFGYSLTLPAGLFIAASFRTHLGAHPDTAAEIRYRALRTMVDWGYEGMVRRTALRCFGVVGHNLYRLRVDDLVEARSAPVLGLGVGVAFHADSGLLVGVDVRYVAVRRPSVRDSLAATDGRVDGSGSVLVELGYAWPRLP